MNRYPIIFLVSLLLASGCKEEPEAIHTRTTSDDVFKTEMTVAALPSEKAHVTLLLSTQYRKERGYPEDVQQKEWFELYFDAAEKEWKTATAQLKISQGFDECVGDSTLVIQSARQPLLIFSKIENLQSSPKTILTEKDLIPQKNIAFHFNENSYQLLPVGSFTDNQGSYIPAGEVDSKSVEALYDYKIRNYSLSLVMNENAPLLLVTQELIEYNIPQLLWAGDLNGDGLPDLIIDTGDFYESKRIILFLSDDKNTPLKKAAEIVVNNDC